jgi:two-component system nitrate/nitrite response regulator NarL
VTDAPVRVVVADNHPLYREALVEAIKRAPGLELLAELGDGRLALAAVQELEPDVAVLDMRMPDLDGMQVLNAIVRDSLPTRVVFLSAYADGKSVYAAFGAGASAYLSKNAPAQEICDAVAVVARGGTVLPPEVQDGVADEIRLHFTDERPLLSPREREMIRLAADGCSAPEMARRLHLSHGTVKTHLAHAYQKLGVSDRAAAVAEAMRRGLLE